MKSRINILLVSILTFNLCEAQPQLAKKIEISKRTSVYFFNHSPVSSYIYELNNIGSDTVWLWFDKSNWMESTDSLVIKSYFMTFKPGDEFDLYHMAMDGNVGSFIPHIYGTFLKAILPNKSFLIQIISKETVNQIKGQEFDSHLNEHLVYFPQKTILKYIPSLTSIQNFIFFKNDFITLFEEDLMK